GRSLLDRARIVRRYPGKLPLLRIRRVRVRQGHAIGLSVNRADHADALGRWRRQVVVTAARLHEPGVVAKPRQHSLVGGGGELTTTRFVDLLVAGDGSDHALRLGDVE